LLRVSKVVFESVFFEDEDCSVEEEVLKGEYSFAYLREDKLKCITAYDNNGKKINDLLNKLHLEIKSSNIFRSRQIYQQSIPSGKIQRVN